VAPVTVWEAYRQIIDASVQSTMVTGVELLLLDDPVLKLRVHVGTRAFIDVFVNVGTGKTSYALIKEGRRLFGADNTRGWHLHPFDSPESHRPCVAMSFETFLEQVEHHTDQWASD
jgi:hypothetical protein